MRRSQHTPLPTCCLFPCVDDLGTEESREDRRLRVQLLYESQCRLERRRFAYYGDVPDVPAVTPTREVDPPRHAAGGGGECELYVAWDCDSDEGMDECLGEFATRAEAEFECRRLNKVAKDGRLYFVLPVMEEEDKAEVEAEVEAEEEAVEMAG